MRPVFLHDNFPNLAETNKKLPPPWVASYHREKRSAGLILKNTESGAVCQVLFLGVTQFHTASYLMTTAEDQVIIIMEENGPRATVTLERLLVLVSDKLKEIIGREVDTKKQMKAEHRYVMNSMLAKTPPADS
jgi:hypothetical protein